MNAEAANFIDKQNADIRAAADAFFNLGDPAPPASPGAPPPHLCGDEPAPIPPAPPTPPPAAPTPPPQRPTPPTNATPTAPTPRPPAQRPAQSQPGQPVNSAGGRLMRIGEKWYCPVSERIRLFRADHPTWAILTDILCADGKNITVTCTVKDDGDRIIATAHAAEVCGSSTVNRTSALENCETSAIGRALGYCGYGVDVAIASADDVGRAASMPPARSAEEEARASDLRRQMVQVYHQLDPMGQHQFRDKAGRSLRELSLDQLIELNVFVTKLASDNLM